MNPPAANSVMVFDEPGGPGSSDAPFDYEELVALISARIAHLPRYRQKIREVHGHWGKSVRVSLGHTVLIPMTLARIIRFPIPTTFLEASRLSPSTEARFILISSRIGTVCNSGQRPKGPAYRHRKGSALYLR